MTTHEMTFRMTLDVSLQEKKGRRRWAWSPVISGTRIKRATALAQMIEISYLATTPKDWAGVSGTAKQSEVHRRQRQQAHLVVAKALSWPWLNTSQVGLLTGYSPQYIDWMRTHNKLVAVADSTAAVRGTFTPRRLQDIMFAVTMLEEHGYCPPEAMNRAVAVGQPAFVGHMLGFPTYRVRRWAAKPLTEQGVCVDVRTDGSF